MNFFQEQERSRQHTLWLVVIFFIAVLVLIGVTILFVIGLYLYLNDIPLADFLVDPFAYVGTRLFYGACMPSPAPRPVRLLNPDSQPGLARS